MIKVSIVTAEMRGINGANRVTEKLIFGLSFFERNNIKLNYLHTDVSSVKCCDYSSTLGEYSTNYLKKRSIIERLKKLPLYRTKLIQSHLQKKVIKYSKKAVERYLSSEDDSEVVIFQDVFCAYHFLKSKNKKTVKTIFITHTDKDPLEHYLINRPELKNSKTEIKIRNIYSLVFNGVDKVVSICPQAESFLSKKYGIKPACIINGIEDTQFIKKTKKQSEFPINVILLGTVTYRKGHDLVLNAMINLDEEVRNKLSIHIVGKGDFLEELKAKAIENSIDDLFVFHGEIKDVAYEISNMDVMLLPSRADTVPISIIEGLRAGLPVFATPNGEVPNMINGCGELFDCDTKSVETILKNIVNGKYDLVRLGINSRKKYEENYNIEKMINNYSKVIAGIEGK